MKTNMIIPGIARDFDVELIASSGDSYFFSALRYDVWHFVHAIISQPETYWFHTDFKQWRIPRYIVAKKMEYLRVLDGSISSTPFRSNFGFPAPVCQ